MNLGAHIVVAKRLVDDDPAYWMGAALPDIAGMGGFRLLGSTDHGRVAAGIAFHHRTDEAFHHHVWFNDIQRPLREALLGAGLDRGPARAIAHVGPELLLDGRLIGPPRGGENVEAIDAAFDTINGLHSDLASLVRSEHRERWGTHLDRAARWRPSGEDHRVEAIARRLHRILARRPRLAFDAGHIDAVAVHLAPVDEHIADTADSFVTELVELLRAA